MTKSDKRLMKMVDDLRNRHGRNSYKVAIPSYKVERTIPSGNGFGNCFKRDILNEHKWKRDRQESSETIKEIEAKAKRVAPAFNKGATQYITDEADPKTLGRKV